VQAGGTTTAGAADTKDAEPHAAFEINLGDY